MVPFFTVNMFGVYPLSVYATDTAATNLPSDGTPPLSVPAALHVAEGNGVVSIVVPVVVNGDGVTVVSTLIVLFAVYPPLSTYQPRPNPATRTSIPIIIFEFILFTPLRNKIIQLSNQQIIQLSNRG